LEVGEGDRGPGMSGVVRPATVADAEEVCEVLRRSITECCGEDHGNDLQKIEAWLANKTTENVERWITAEGNYSVVVEWEGRVAGVAMLLRSGELALCYLLPEVRFRGLGQALLTAIETEARLRGLEQLELESTQTAHSFYARNGYVDCGAVNVRFGSEGFPMSKDLSGLIV
jgi:GNAT superfamily N-acetyltransferase